MSDKKVAYLADAARDSRLWTARQCLQDLIDDIDAGRIDPDKMLVLHWERTPEGTLRRHEACVGMTNVEHVAFLTEAQHAAIEKWRNRE